MNKQEETRWVKFLGGKNVAFTLIIICLIAATILLLNKISFVFKPLVVVISAIFPSLVFAIVLYYLFNPLVSLLNKKQFSRSMAIMLIFALIILLFIFAGMQLFPIIQKQTQELLAQLPQLINGFQEKAYELVSKTPFDHQFDKILASMDELSEKFSSFLANYWQAGAKQLGSIFSVVSSTLFTLFTGPIIAYFLLKDPQKCYQTVLKIVPPVFRKDFREIVKTADEQLGAFLKGQVIASILLGLIYWVVFMLIHLKFAGVLALAAGVLSIIPYVGAFLAFFPGLFVAAQTSLWMVVKFVVLWFVVQLLHGDLVVPRVMGDKLKIHPITILFVLLVMGNLFGVIGVIFGIPIYSLIKLFVVFAFRKFKKRYNQYYGAKGEYDKTDFTKEDYLE